MKRRMLVYVLLIALVGMFMISSINITSAAGTIKVQMYNANTAATTNTIYPDFQLVNLSSSAITLSTVTIRYYYTNDTSATASYTCDYSSVGTGNVTGTIVAMSPTYSTADHYLQIGFTSGAGSLAAGAGVVIQGRIYKSDWSNFTQTNDYSFNSTATTFVDWTYATGYVSGTLQWGTEPGGSTVAPTSAATPTPTTVITPTATPTPSGSVTGTPTATPVKTATPTPTPTPTMTGTPTPTMVPTPTPTSGPVGTSGLPVPPVSANQPRPSGSQGGLSVLPWAGFTAAGSFTMDDNNTSVADNLPSILGTGIRLTFYIVSTWPNAGSYMSALQAGSEIGNHSATHQETCPGGSDLDECTAYLQQTYGITPLTFAIPYGNYSSYGPYLPSRFLLARGVDGGTNPPYSGNAYDLLCNIPPTGASASTMASYFSSAISAGGWCILLVHGFTGDPNAYQPVDLAQYLSAINTVKGYSNMWIDTLLNVGAYWTAQQLPIISQQSGTNIVYSWTLPAHFPSGKYIRIKLTGGTPMQNGQTINWDGHGYYEVALDPGTLTVTP